MLYFLLETGTTPIVWEILLDFTSLFSPSFLLILKSFVALLVTVFNFLSTVTLSAGISYAYSSTPSFRDSLLRGRFVFTDFMLRIAESGFFIGLLPYFKGRTFKNLAARSSMDSVLAFAYDPSNWLPFFLELMTGNLSRPLLSLLAVLSSGVSLQSSSLKEVSLGLWPCLSFWFSIRRAVFSLAYGRFSLVAESLRLI